MKKYFAPRKCISGDWTNNHPNIEYFVSEINIKEKIIYFKNNLPYAIDYIVEYPEHSTQSNFIYDKTAKLNKIYENKEDAQNECFNLNLNNLSKYNKQYDELQM